MSSQRILRRQPVALLAFLYFLCLICQSSAMSAPLLSVTPANAFSGLVRRQATVDSIADLPKFTCTVVGECQACNALQIGTEEVCKDTHNRQRIDCKFVDQANEDNEELKVKLPKYHSCLRVKAVETRRFAHFLSTNVFFAFFSGLLMVWRKRKLAAAQYRRMARRIGIA